MENKNVKKILVHLLVEKLIALCDYSWHLKLGDYASVSLFIGRARTSELRLFPY